MFNSVLEGLTVAVLAFASGVAVVDVVLTVRHRVRQLLVAREAERALRPVRSDRASRGRRRLHTNDHAAA